MTLFLSSTFCIKLKKTEINRQKQEKKKNKEKEREKNLKKLVIKILPFIRFCPPLGPRKSIGFILCEETLQTISHVKDGSPQTNTYII